MMSAALHASDETVSYLLSLGASPDVTDVKNRTALMDAIESKCASTINLLAPVHYVQFVKYDVTVSFMAQVLDTVTYLVPQVLDTAS